MKKNIPDWHSLYNLLIFEETDSTNEEAKRIASNSPKGNYVVWAKKQTHGKGRNGRKWVSEAGNLFVSVLMHPYDIKFAAYLPFIISLSVGEVLAKYIPKDDIKYKWPNDVLIGGKKIAGILIETKVNNHSFMFDWLIAGIGINLNSSPSNMPYPTTNLKKESKLSSFPIEEIIDEFMTIFLAKIDFCGEEGFKEIRRLWLDQAFGLGQVITVSTANNRISGKFENINESGAIELRLANGDLTIVSSGEVFFEKPHKLFNSF